ncbi:MAG: hypothetical protein RLZZ450_6307 [Pseudomonadota bacterium]|jgi:hypothetical protein
MIRTFVQGLLGVVGLFVVWGATTAKAELSACGGIFLDGNAKCEYREKGLLRQICG